MTNEEAIEVIKQDIPCEHDADLIEALDMAIKAIEQTTWIPVSERLPEKDGEYLITKKDKLGNYMKISRFYSCKQEWFLENGNIIAWMPLPKPYEPQESEE